jgi:hypothetical protein
VCTLLHMKPSVLPKRRSLRSLARSCVVSLATIKVLDHPSHSQPTVLYASPSQSSSPHRSPCQVLSASPTSRPSSIFTSPPVLYAPAGLSSPQRCLHNPPILYAPQILYAPPGHCPPLMRAEPLLGPSGQAAHGLGRKRRPHKARNALIGRVPLMRVQQILAPNLRGGGGGKHGTWVKSGFISPRNVCETESPGAGPKQSRFGPAEEGHHR